MLDLAPLDGSDPEENFATVERELALHDPRLAALPRVLALSKADLVPAARPRREAADARGAREVGETRPGRRDLGATGQGLDELRAELLRRVPVAGARPTAPGLAGEEELAEHRVFRPAERRGFEVERVGEGAFRVTGEPVERLHRPPRPRQRGRAGPRRAPPAPHGRRRGRSKAPGFEPGTTSRSPAWCSSSIPGSAGR